MFRNPQFYSLNKSLVVFIILILTSGFHVYSQKNLVYESLNTNSKKIYDLCLAQDSTTIIIPDSINIKAVDITNNLLKEFKGGHDSHIISLDLSKDNSLLASGGIDGTIVVWDYINNEILKKIKPHSNSVVSLSFSNDNRYLASCGLDGSIILYDLVTDELSTLFSTIGLLSKIRFNSSGTMIYFSEDSSIKVIELENNNIVQTLSGHKDLIRDFVLGWGERDLLSCGDDKRIVHWRISQNIKPSIYVKYKLHSNWVLTIDYDSDSDYFVSGDISGKFNINGPYSSIKGMVFYPIHKCIFIPNPQNHLIIALATKGRGVLLIDAINLKDLSK